MAVESIEQEETSPPISRRQFLRLGFEVARTAAAAVAVVSGVGTLITGAQASDITERDPLIAGLKQTKLTTIQPAVARNTQLSTATRSQELKESLGRETQLLQQDVIAIDHDIAARTEQLQPAIDAKTSQAAFFLKATGISAAIGILPRKGFWKAIYNFFGD